MRRLIALLALSAVAACGSDNSTNPISFAGTWNLTTVNGSPLPVTVQASNPKIEVLSDQITATAAGTFTETFNNRFTSTTGEVTTQPGTDSGTWTVSGTTVTLHFSSDGTTFTATISGNTFTAAQAGFSAVYAKQ